MSVHYPKDEILTPVCWSGIEAMSACTAVWVIKIAFTVTGQCQCEMANGDDAYEVMRCRRLERRAGVRIMKEFNMLFEDTQSDCIYLWNTTELLMGPLEILICITLSDNPY